MSDLILNNSITATIGLSILHSVWQIAIISLLVFIILRMLPNISSRKRYYIILAGFPSILISFILTSVILYVPNQEIALTKLPITNNLSLITSEINLVNSTDFLLSIKTLLSQNTHIIALIWLIGIFVLAIKNTGGLYYAHRIIKTCGCELNHSETTSILISLKKKLRINKDVKLYTSTKAHSPFVWGVFKPIIVIPTSLILGLSNDHIESILAHELAHIKHADFIINLYVVCIETLFFYHPAIWWMSKILEKERENACDDAVIYLINDPKIYAYTLAEIQEYKLLKSNFAMNINSKNYQLLNRIQRLFNVQKRPSYVRETSILLLILTISFVGLVSFKHKNLTTTFKNISHTDKSVTANIPKTELNSNSFLFPKDTSRASEYTFYNSDSLSEAVVYEFLSENENGSLSKFEMVFFGLDTLYPISEYEFAFDSVYITEKYNWSKLNDEIREHQEHVAKEMEAFMREIEKEYIDTVFDDLQAQQQFQDELRKHYEQIEQYRKQLESEYEHNTGKWEQEKNKLLQEIAQQRSQWQNQISDEQLKQQQEELKEMIETMQEQAQLERNMALEEHKRAQAELLSHIEEQKELEQTIGSQSEQKPGLLSRLSTLETNLATELVKDEIIKLESDLASFKITDNEKVFVNSNKIPAKYWEKYIKIFKQSISDKNLVIHGIDIQFKD